MDEMNDFISKNQASKINMYRSVAKCLMNNKKVDISETLKTLAYCF